MKRTLSILVLLAITPFLTGCGISKSFTIHKGWSCGCHSPYHDDHCSHKHKHRPHRSGSHDPDPGHDYFFPHASSTTIVQMDHYPAPRAKPPRVKPVHNSASKPQSAVGINARSTKSKKTNVAKKRGR